MSGGCGAQQELINEALSGSIAVIDRLLGASERIHVLPRESGHKQRAVAAVAEGIDGILQGFSMWM